MAFGDKGRFLIKNLVRGIFWLVIIITAFVLLKNHVEVELFNKLVFTYEHTIIVISIYIGSETVFGIIPPELFMIWALGFESLSKYIILVLIFASLSYLAGIAGFLFGNFLSQSKTYRLIKKYFLQKYMRYLYRYGGFLVIVASLTPIPFSGVAMLVGSLKYPLKSYLLFSLFRFVRFAVYGFIIWEANII